MCIASDSYCCFIDLSDVALQVADKDGIAGIVEQVLLASRRDFWHIDDVQRPAVSPMRVSAILFIQYFHGSIPGQSG